MPANFEFLEHPSDIGILARGDSREAALIEASKGLISIIVDPSAVRARESRDFYISGTDAASQVVNWLNEILFYFDTEGLMLAHFSIDSWTSNGIIGRAQGEQLDPARHELRTAVKAATYHQFQLQESGGQWELRVFVDV